MPSAASGWEPGRAVRQTPRVAVVLDDAPAATGPCRVEAPDRVLRMYVLLNAAADEVRRPALTAETAGRVNRQLDAVTDELERSVSPPLAGEMHRLLGTSGTGTPTAAEVRVRYAGLLGWTGGLVVGMLNQLEAARTAQSTARSGRPRAAHRGDAGDPGWT